MKSKSEELSAFNLPVSLSPESSSARAARAAELMVTCPLSGERVILQRCSFCSRSEGLLLDPGDDSLSLRCAHAGGNPFRR